MHYGNQNNTHRFAYQNVVNWEPLWNKTTDKYKSLVLNEFIWLTFAETNSINIIASIITKILKNR